MGVAEQFAGLDMSMLIGAPLTAAADASVMLASATAEFINKVGIDENGRVRNAAFAYQTQGVNDDGTGSLNEMRVEIPMLAIVPLPGLQLDELNVVFDMEVKQSEKVNKEMKTGMGLSGGAGFGPAKANISGSISSHRENTRSTDYSAKYHVDIKAANHGTPEGLARVLDMIAANLSPTLIDSTLKNADGLDLPEEHRIRAEKRKLLRKDMAEMELRQKAAWNYFQDCIARMRETAAVQMNIYRAALERLTEAPKQREKAGGIAEDYEKMAASWSNLNEQAENIIRMIVDIGEDKSGGVSDLFHLLAMKDGKLQRYGTGEAQYHALAAAQGNAAAALKQFSEIGKALADKRAEYSRTLTYQEAEVSGNSEEKRMSEKK